MANCLASTDNISRQLSDQEQFFPQADHVGDASLSGSVDVNHVSLYFISELLRGRKSVKQNQCLISSQIFIDLVPKKLDI